MTDDIKNEDARAAVPGFMEATAFTSKRHKRSSFCDNEIAKILNYEFATNPLTLVEQKHKTKTNLNTTPESMVYYAHTKEDRNKCGKIMINNALQYPLCFDDDVIAVADHYTNLECNDPDAAKRAAFEDLRSSGYRPYDPIAGDYDERSPSRWVDEMFYKGALHQVDLTDKQTFIELYTDYSNSTSTLSIEPLAITSNQHCTLSCPPFLSYPPCLPRCRSVRTMGREMATLG